MEGNELNRETSVRVELCNVAAIETTMAARANHGYIKWTISFIRFNPCLPVGGSGIISCIVVAIMITQEPSVGSLWNVCRMRDLVVARR